MIPIYSSPTVDIPRAEVTEERLTLATLMHLHDVCQCLLFFKQLLDKAGMAHDDDKLKNMSAFHRFFQGQHPEWSDAHIKANRHHLTFTDGVPDDVNLIDVLEYIADCVASGLSRKGEVYKVDIAPHVLEEAFRNTVTLLIGHCEVKR